MAKRAAKKKTEGAKHLKEQLVRALADYDNLRKRVERERSSRGRRSASWRKKPGKNY